jgi:NTE family protein
MAGSQKTGPRIGLALGGGGARGLAHIAMLEAFDELGLRPSIIAGCSMGAVVGAAYAAGMSAAEIRAHAEKHLSNRMVLMRHIFGTRKLRPTEIISLQSLTSVHLDGVRLADIALPANLPRNIEDTAIPLKIIATNYRRMEEAVFTSGPLLQALGASIAIPGLIKGPEINGELHVDGGVVNPVPFDHVRQGMDIVVAIDVTGKPRNALRKHPSNIEIAVGSLLIMFHQLASHRRALSPPDIYITPEISNFGTGDFFRVPAILAAAQSAKDELKSKLESLIKTVA